MANGRLRKAIDREQMDSMDTQVRSFTAGPDSIRTATRADLKVLSDYYPADEEYFGNRLDRQRSGLGELIIAWRGDCPVGDLYIWRQPADESKIRRCLPGVPLLQRIRVRADLRRNGIGTKLITLAEELLRMHGHDDVALAVETRNEDAQRLYERLAYVRWSNGLVLCRSRKPYSGHGQVELEACHVMVKSLTARISPGEATGARLA